MARRPSRVYRIDPDALAGMRAYLDRFWSDALAAFEDPARAEEGRWRRRRTQSAARLSCRSRGGGRVRPLHRSPRRLVAQGQPSPLGGPRRRRFPRAARGRPLVRTRRGWLPSATGATSARSNRPSGSSWPGSSRPNGSTTPIPPGRGGRGPLQCRGRWNPRDSGAPRLRGPRGARHRDEELRRRRRRLAIFAGALPPGCVIRLRPAARSAGSGGKLAGP